MLLGLSGKLITLKSVENVFNHSCLSRSVHGEINSTELNDLKDSLINNLPEGVSLPPELKDIDLESGAKQAVDIFKTKCIENSGSDAAFEQASV